MKRTTTRGFFQALHQTLRHPLALRVPRTRLLAERPELRRELLDEARLLAPLQHSHLVRLIDFVDEGAVPFLVFEFVKGLSLGQLIQQSGRLRWDRAVRVLTQIAGALATAWQAGLPHGHLWPGQVLVTPDGVAKLLHAGRILRQGLALDEKRTGYLAPEQLRPGEPVDQQADIFTLGVIGYEMLSGRRPFADADRSGPPQWRDALVEVPALVFDLLERMTAIAPSDRIDSYATLLHELQAIRLPGWAVQE